MKRLRRRLIAALAGAAAGHGLAQSDASSANTRLIEAAAGGGLSDVRRLVDAGASLRPAMPPGAPPSSPRRRATMKPLPGC